MQIKFQDVWKTYGEGHTAVNALRSLDLDEQKGRFSVILGPSGSGKTTLLNMLGALDEPSRGLVEVDGVDLTRLDTDERVEFRRNEVGFVFQFFNLIPTLTALENVELVAALTMTDGTARSKESLDLVGLGDRLNHFPAQLSGGEQQRVAIARALVKRPPILLCDEPTGELDFETGRKIISLLRRLNEENNQTVLVVTHNSAIGDVGDRVVRLRSGEVVEDTLNESPLNPQELIW